MKPQILSIICLQYIQNDRHIYETISSIHFIKILECMNFDAKNNQNNAFLSFILTESKLLNKVIH